MESLKSHKELKSALAFYADDGFREFIMRGIPSERPFIGVRTPRIREIVSRLTPEAAAEVLAVEPVAFEEVLARGMIITGLPYDEMLKWFDSQIIFADDWCSCDTFCASLKQIRKHRADFFDQKIDDLLFSSQEFATRAGLVLLKCHFLEPDYLAVIFDRIERLASREEYYVKMALAWMVAECFTRFPAESLAYMKSSRLPAWTFNKAISKICDSYRVDPNLKEILKSMRKPKSARITQGFFML